MEDLGLHATLVIAAVIVTYAIVCNRLAKATQPLRVEAIGKAMKLIDDPRVSSTDRRELAMLVDFQFTFVLPWALALTLIPLGLFALWTNGKIHGTKGPLAEEINQARDLCILAPMGLYPIAGLLVAIQAVVLMILTGSTHSLGRVMDALMSVRNSLCSAAHRSA